MIIRARAPMRLGLAGGGTDISSYSDVYGGKILNATINKYAYTTIETNCTPEISFHSIDLEVAETIDLNSNIKLNGSLKLLKAAYVHIIENFNNSKRIPITLTTFCDAPAGSGLGASSTLVVSIVKALGEYLSLPFDDYTIAKIAYVVERDECLLLGGKQDQYSASFGGLNFMEFNKDKSVIVNPLRISPNIICELEASLLLFYIGVSRESAKIIQDQNNNVKNQINNAVEAFHIIKEEAVTMKDALLTGNFDGIINSMNKSWEKKKQSANSVSNDLIDEIYIKTKEAGSLAGKVSGAGGGGFMMFFVPPTMRVKVINLLKKYTGQIDNVNFTNIGAQSWKIR